MASKTGRRANAAGKKKGNNIPVPKDDGSRWIVVNHETGEQVYSGSGVSRSQAEHLGTGLVAPARLVCTVEATT